MELMKWFLISERHIRMYLDQRFLPLGINSSQHMYIIKVCDHPGITQDRFMAQFYIHPSNITRALCSLEKSGFIIRKPSEADKRTSCLYPTQKAQDIYAEIKKIMHQADRDLMAGLSESDMEKSLELVKTIGENAIRLAKLKD